MSFFNPPAPPASLLGYHRILSPTAAVKVSPLCLGGISIGSSWNETFGKTEESSTLLDEFYNLGGNFIDTSSVYNSEDSERLIGEWMEKRGVRDEMVIATKYSAGYKTYLRETGEKGQKVLQSNFVGNSAKSMHVSIRDSLKKLRTDYIDVLYVHWWDFTTSVEEVMTHLHAYIMARQVLYLGVSDTPAWVVVKANEFARRNGLTPFSVYQGRWNAAYRDMEAEIIPMCEDQGMAIVSWASLGGGQLMTKSQRDDAERNKDSRPASYGKASDDDLKVCDALEKIADEKGVAFQAVALAYLLHQSPYIFPIVGVQTVEHVKALPDALRVRLSPEDIQAIHTAKSFDPLFPLTFLYGLADGKGYHLGLGPKDNSQLRIAAWIDAPPKQPVYESRMDEQP